MGIWMPPQKARILDAVRRSGQEGTRPEDLSMSRDLFKAHVWALNHFYLPETDFRIRGSGGEYRLVKGDYP